MSTKFFNNIESTLMDKFHGIASAMANFDIFHAVVGYFRSSGYFKLRQELDATQEIKILVGINIDNLFRQSQAAGKLFFGDKEVSTSMERCHSGDLGRCEPYRREDPSCTTRASTHTIRTIHADAHRPLRQPGRG
jgi:hypothetical protein